MKAKEKVNLFPEAEKFLSGIVKSGLSVATEKNYRGSIEKLSAFFNIDSVKKIENITAEDFRNFVYELNVSSASQNFHIRNLRSFLGWLKENDFIASENISSAKFNGKSKYIKEEKKGVFALTEEEIGKILACARKGQERFMIEFMLNTGLRAGSICNLKLSDIREDGSFTIRKAKGNKTIDLAMSERLFEKYQEYLKIRKTNSEYLFFSQHGIDTVEDKMTPQSVNHRVKSAVAKTDISKERKEKIHAHTTRATFATKAIEKYGIDAARQALCHENSATTQRYNASNVAAKVMKSFSYDEEGDE